MNFENDAEEFNERGPFRYLLPMRIGVRDLMITITLLCSFLHMSTVNLCITEAQAQDWRPQFGDNLYKTAPPKRIGARKVRRAHKATPHLYIFVTRGFFISKGATKTSTFLHSLLSTRFFLRTSLGELADLILCSCICPHRSSLEYIMCGIFGYCSFLKEKVSS